MKVPIDLDIQLSGRIAEVKPVASELSAPSNLEHDFMLRHPTNGEKEGFKGKFTGAPATFSPVRDRALAQSPFQLASLGDVGILGNSVGKNTLRFATSSAGKIRGIEYYLADGAGGFSAAPTFVFGDVAFNEGSGWWRLPFSGASTTKRAAKLRDLLPMAHRDTDVFAKFLLALLAYLSQHSGNIVTYSWGDCKN